MLAIPVATITRPFFTHETHGLTAFDDFDIHDDWFSVAQSSRGITQGLEHTIEGCIARRDFTNLRKYIEFLAPVKDTSWLDITPIKQDIIVDNKEYNFLDNNPRSGIIIHNNGVSSSEGQNFFTMTVYVSV